MREVVASGSLGFLGGSQKIYMASWHNRSFVAVIGNSRNVSLYTLDAQTLQVWEATVNLVTLLFSFFRVLCCVYFGFVLYLVFVLVYCIKAP